jgi:glutathione-regulated potassium-efflux system ancillary protein KefF
MTSALEPSHATPATAPSAVTDIYVVAAHPNWRESRVNRPLFEAARAQPRCTVTDLYASYTDYAIDVPVEQTRLSAAQLVVLLHPVQWYGMPALLKLWVDEVLTWGWAYGPGQALKGKDLWLVASTGGSVDSYQTDGYNRYPFEAFLPPYDQTAALCGMRFVPPLLFHAAHKASTQTLAAHVQRFSDALARYPHWPELVQAGTNPQCQVPITDRPLAEPSADV